MDTVAIALWKLAIMCRPHFYIALLLLVFTLAVFYQVRDHDFISDDYMHIVENPYLKPVTLPRVLELWQKPYWGLYIPVTYTVWAAIARLAELPGAGQNAAKLDPRPFHSANLVLHLVNLLIVFAILRMLTRNDWAASCGALLFALHPVQVEPVAWVSGLKDVLSGFFSLLALWQYLAYAAATSSSANAVTARGEMANVKRGVFHFAVATLAFVLALLSKPAAAMVPLAAWLLDRYVLQRTIRQCTMALISWIVLAVPFAVLTKWSQPDAGIEFLTPIWVRPLVAGDALAFYLYQLAVPLSLGPDYSRRPELVLQHGWIYLVWLLPFGLAVLIWLGRHKRPWLVASGGVFVMGTVPTLGLVPFSFQDISTVADRYLYFSFLGPALLLACFLSEPRRRRDLTLLLCVGLLTLLGIRSASQAGYWSDSITLYHHVLEINPRSWLAHVGLGDSLAEQRKFEQAMAHYLQALRIRPNDASTHNNLGNILARQRKFEEAGTQYLKALRIEPNNAAAHNNLANVLVEQNDLGQAIAHYLQALQIDPEYETARHGLSLAIEEQRRRTSQR